MINFHKTKPIVQKQSSSNCGVKKVRSKNKIKLTKENIRFLKLIKLLK